MLVVLELLLLRHDEVPQPEALTLLSRHEALVQLEPALLLPRHETLVPALVLLLEPALLLSRHEALVLLLLELPGASADMLEREWWLHGHQLGRSGPCTKVAAFFLGFLMRKPDGGRRRTVTSRRQFDAPLWCH